MKTGDKILAYCTKPRTAQELATHCKVQRSSIYSALGRLQMKGILTRLGDGTERATYVLNEPSLSKSHAKNGLGLQIRKELKFGDNMDHMKRCLKKLKLNLRTKTHEPSCS
jgi:hypothetical protein